MHVGVARHQHVGREIHAHIIHHHRILIRSIKQTVWESKCPFAFFGFIISYLLARMVKQGAPKCRTVQYALTKN